MFKCHPYPDRVNEQLSIIVSTFSRSSGGGVCTPLTSDHRVTGSSPPAGEIMALHCEIFHNPSHQPDMTEILFKSAYIAHEHQYRIYLAIRRGFHLSRMTTNNLISCM